VFPVNFLIIVGEFPFVHLVIFSSIGMHLCNILLINMCSLNNKIILLANYTLACAQKPTIKQEAEYEKAIKTKKLVSQKKCWRLKSVHIADPNYNKCFSLLSLTQQKSSKQSIILPHCLHVHACIFRKIVRPNSGSDFGFRASFVLDLDTAKSVSQETYRNRVRMDS